MKLLKRIAMLTLSLIMAFSTCIMFGCDDGSTGDGTEEAIDSSRTQIYVYNYNGGYGSEWLAGVKRRFEALHADKSYEEGKMGVQIYVNAQKTTFNSMTSTILTSNDEVFFGEQGFYNTLKKGGILADITDVVTTPLTEYGETRSIVDKLSNEQKNFYGLVENGATHYYALPHYLSNFGFIYNVDLFDELGYYVKKGTSDENAVFIKKSKGAVSNGPDGKTGVVGGIDYTEDDGLPATYAEFFALCDLMIEDGVVPVSWCGNAYGEYLNSLRLALASEAMGLEEMMLNYTLRGTAKTLSTVDLNGQITSLGDTQILPATAYKLAQQSGWYHALSFLERLTMTANYHNTLAYNGAYSHIDAQEDFINAGLDGRTQEMGMLMDGTWWESEATSAYDRMVQGMGDKYAKNKRNFKMMPLPKPTQAHVQAAAASAKPYTRYSEHAPLCFIKANAPSWKMSLLKEFMRFVHTDVSLREFTTTTNAMRAFDYTLTETDLNGMTTFGKSLVTMKTMAEFVYPYSSDPGYTANESAYSSSAYLTKAIVSGKSYSGWLNAYKDYSVTPEDYFAGIYSYSQANPIVPMSGTV